MGSTMPRDAGAKTTDRRKVTTVSARERTLSAAPGRPLPPAWPLASHGAGLYAFHTGRLASHGAGPHAFHTGQCRAGSAFMPKGRGGENRRADPATRCYAIARGTHPPHDYLIIK